MNFCEWLGIPVLDESEELLTLLGEGHRRAAHGNDNASSQAVRMAAVCGVPFESAIASAVLTFGVKHAPISETRHFLYRLTEAQQDQWIQSVAKVPGWGNSFYKSSIDPSFAPIDHHLRKHWPIHAKRLMSVGDRIFASKGYMLCPNAASFTAVVAEIIGVPTGTEGMLAIGFRLPVWADQFATAVLVSS
jgi:citrate synthase